MPKPKPKPEPKTYQGQRARTISDTNPPVRSRMGIDKKRFEKWSDLELRKGQSNNDYIEQANEVEAMRSRMWPGNRAKIKKET